MSNIIATDAATFRPTGIKNLVPGLVERGKIKIGKKGAARQSQGGGTYQMPQKLDHFTVTTTERGADGNFLTDVTIMQMIGDKPKEIPVRLIYDDIALNFPSRYAAYSGKSLFCTGDGERAKQQSPGGLVMVQCPCPRQEPTYTGKDKCKPTGVLSVVIEGAEVVGGVWKFRTTSYNTVVGILSSLAMIQRISGGRLAGIPLVMKLSPKTVQDPTSGAQQVVYIVSIEFRGSVSELREQGYQALLQDKEHGARIDQLENTARLMLAQRDEYEEDADEITDEFYPEAAADATGATVHTARPPARTFVQAAEEPATEEPAAIEPPPAAVEPPRAAEVRAPRGRRPAAQPPIEQVPDLPPAPPADLDDWGFGS
jgi:hypothetical protein